MYPPSRVITSPLADKNSALGEIFKQIFLKWLLVLFVTDNKPAQQRRFTIAGRRKSLSRSALRLWQRNQSFGLAARTDKCSHLFTKELQTDFYVQCNHKPVQASFSVL